MTISSQPSSYASYRDVYRFKHIDWTWLRANELYEYVSEPLPDFDTAWICRTLRYLKARSGKDLPPAAEPAEDFSDIQAAHQVHEDSGLFRDVLQSYLLTRVPMERIAAQMGLSAATVTAYEQIFFDVRTRLRSRGWIMNMAVGRPLLTQEGCTLGQVLCRMAYFAGEYVLNNLVAYLQKHFPTALPMPLSTATLSEAEDRSIHRCLALEMLTLDKRSAVLLFRQHAEMLAQQAAGGHDPGEATASDAWLEHVTFSGEGSQLTATLDPDWLPQHAAVA